MEINDNKISEIAKNKETNQELSKIKDLSKTLDVSDNKSHISLQDADKSVENRLAQNKESGETTETASDTVEKVEDKYNKGTISFGISGCAAFCKKVHDGTQVHGTY